MTVLVLVLVLTDVEGVVVAVVVVGAVVSVVVGVVAVVVVVGAVVSVEVAVVPSAVELGATAGAELDVSGVSDAVVGFDRASPVMAFARPKMISATMTAPSAPNATSAAGLRYQGVGAT